jgi:hypothetical protein
VAAALLGAQVFNRIARPLAGPGEDDGGAGGGAGGSGRRWGAVGDRAARRTVGERVDAWVRHYDGSRAFLAQLAPDFRVTPTYLLDARGTAAACRRYELLGHADVASDPGLAAPPQHHPPLCGLEGGGGRRRLRPPLPRAAGDGEGEAAPDGSEWADAAPRGASIVVALALARARRRASDASASPAPAPAPNPVAEPAGAEPAGAAPAPAPANAPRPGSGPRAAAGVEGDQLWPKPTRVVFAIVAAPRAPRAPRVRC